MTSEGCLRENCFIFVSFSDEMWWHVAGPCSAKYFACDDVNDDVMTTSAKKNKCLAVFNLLACLQRTLVRGRHGDV